MLQNLTTKGGEVVVKRMEGNWDEIQRVLSSKLIIKN